MPHGPTEVYAAAFDHVEVVPRTRLKQHANPTVLRLHRSYRGNRIPVEGVALQEFKDRLQRQVFDADVEIRYRSRAYGGRRRGHVLRGRLVGMLDEASGLHHW